MNDFSTRLRINIILIIYLLIPFSLFSQNKEAEEILNKRGEICISFESDKNEINYFSEIISIDKYSDNQVIGYANKVEFKNFLATKKDYSIIERNYSSKSLNVATNIEEMENWDKYPSYEIYVEMMQKFANNFPAICKLDTIGYSVENRLLLAVKISDNVTEDEIEPEVFLSGQMHGDELVGGIVLLKLIGCLLNEYETNQQIYNLINNLQIYINPLANPDGTYFGGNDNVSESTRYNKNNKDLNRNFPRIDGIATYIEPEIQAMINYAENHKFVLSLNTHSGAEVVNYPWDFFSHLPADNDWWNFVSRQYATTVHNNSINNYLTYLDNGITNGYQWYSITGSRQDYMNYFKNCREVTLELSDTKLLPSEEINNYFNYNKNALLNYISQANYGLRGIITDSLTNEPIKAKVLILNHDKDNSHVFSFQNTGEYYRFLYTGNYFVNFSAEGYQAKTIKVNINNFETQIFDIQLVDCDTCHETNNIPNSEINNINIFPNPTNDLINIKSEENIQEIEIFNNLGQKIDTFFPNNTEFLINIQKYLSNFIIINIKINGKFTVRKIVIK
ncbi:MAG: T9SS type A sorting domain-containing protein [Bacteroidales bacterium]|jgi:hypothetical protein|nr:T9SS type A sorting domain-containing protein [Bacteroidales bacterium]